MELFDKCLNYTDAKDAMAHGIYPYFIALEESEVPAAAYRHDEIRGPDVVPRGAGVVAFSQPVILSAAVGRRGQREGNRVAEVLLAESPGNIVV